MRARSLFGQSGFSYPIISSPLLSIGVLTYLGVIPLWATGLYLALLAVSSLYLKYVRLPHLRRVAICYSYFGMVKCPHKKYLPDEICEPCADSFIARQEQAYVNLIQQQASPPGPKETVH